MERYSCYIGYEDDSARNPAVRDLLHISPPESLGTYLSHRSFLLSTVVCRFPLADNCRSMLCLSLMSWQLPWYARGNFKPIEHRHN